MIEKPVIDYGEKVLRDDIPLEDDKTQEDEE